MPSMGDEADALLRQQAAEARSNATKVAASHKRYLDQYDTLCSWINQVVIEFQNEARRRGINCNYAREILKTKTRTQTAPRIRVPGFGIVDESTITGRAIARVVEAVFARDFFVEHIPEGVVHETVREHESGWRVGIPIFSYPNPRTIALFIPVGSGPWCWLIIEKAVSWDDADRVASMSYNEFRQLIVSRTASDPSLPEIRIFDQILGSSLYQLMLDGQEQFKVRVRPWFIEILAGPRS